MKGYVQTVITYPWLPKPMMFTGMSTCFLSAPSKIMRILRPNRTVLYFYILIQSVTHKVRSSAP